jgi:tight adherence protein B
VRTPFGPTGWDAEALADALEVVASGLRAGLTPAASLVLARDCTEWGRRERRRVDAGVERLRSGLPTAGAWGGEGDSTGATSAYRVVATVWDLSVQTGGPLTTALGDAADHLREEARLQGRIAVLAAAPRASARLLTMLPVLGPGLAVLLGVHPVEVYSSSWVSAASATVGVLLTVVGWRWSRRMVQAAARPRTYDQAAPAPG